MQPINYVQDVQNPFNSFLQGYQGGAAIRDDQAQQQAKLAQAQAQQQMGQDLRALAMNPNASGADYAATITKYPQLADQLTKAWAPLNEQQKQSKLSDGTRIYAALANNRPDVAAQQLRDSATAKRNSGNERAAKEDEDMAAIIEADPLAGRRMIGMSLAANMGVDKFGQTLGQLGSEERAAEQAPAALAKLQGDAAKAGADAETAKVTAKYADQGAMMDLQKKGWDIKKIAADIDIARENSRIAAMNAAISREGNDLKRQELGLKVAEAREKLDEKIRGKVAEAESSAATIDNTLNTIERIKKNPSLNSVLGSLEGKEYYPNSTLGTMNPAGDGDERSDAIALIDTLGSQAFLSQLPAMKGAGALSDAEGKKLQAALTNLNRTQSEKQFRENLDEAARLMTKARENISKRSGVPLGKPDTPAAPGTRPPLSSFNQ